MKHSFKDLRGFLLNFCEIVLSNQCLLILRQDVLLAMNTVSCGTGVLMELVK